MANLPLKICQVNPGCGIEIPPKGWGAIEKIVWEFTKNLRKQGHQVDIKWTNEVKKGEYDLVHVHVANLALILAERGIPYIFQCHDHHAYHYGKDSFVFKQNLEAIENSELSILPAKYLVEYFGSNKAVYFSHGVNTDFFTSNLEKKSHRVLMVANNGLGGKDGHDRKGFTEGIKAAKKIGLPITIAGPKNNKNFIKDNLWVKDYDINWIFDPNQEELLKIYQEHTIFLHPSELEAGHPNLTILEAMSCGLPVVGCIESNLKGMVKVKNNTDNVYKGIQQVLKNYKKFSSQALLTSQKLSWYNRSKDLLKLLKPQNMKDLLIKEYSTISRTPLSSICSPVGSSFSFIEGPKCTIKDNSLEEYKVNFKNHKTNKIYYSSVINNNMWTKCNVKYNLPWEIEIQNPYTNELLHSCKMDLTGKQVYIHFDSKAIGDNLAWIPYVEEFRKINKCKVICSTFYNNWFEITYPNITFVPPGTSVPNIYAKFGLGWYYKDNQLDTSKHPLDPKAQPMQKTASDILGLPYKELKPQIIAPRPSPIQEKYITISIQSTAQAKYWNYKGGWEQVIKFLNKKGYKAICIDKYPNFGKGEYMNQIPHNAIDKTGCSLPEAMSLIKGAQFHLGISSGLSWLSWALNTHVVMISSFSNSYCEFQSNCTRIYNDTPTSGYFNTHQMDSSNWNWYPFREINSIEDWYEIETITPEQVINKIKQIL